MTTFADEQIKHMVSRFLAWKLPETFNPDGGISFKRAFNENTAHPMTHLPSGTNLFDATQAEAMVRHMIEGLASTRALNDIANERRGHFEREGFTPERDDAYVESQLASAAASYALSAAGRSLAASDIWPVSWLYRWFKSSSPRRDLVKAGALIVAEIERLDRLEDAMSKVQP